ncbi:hypothetical protein [Moraxella lacunata]|uniref:hypothetical protein n=1 Tax=Moraxella lacunata TaxID=477 RepID=UPI003EE3E2AD
MSLMMRIKSGAVSMSVPSKSNKTAFSFVISAHRLWALTLATAFGKRHHVVDVHIAIG